jgi:uncharacterized protein
VPNPVVHFEITGADGSALQNFYKELFDWKIDANNQWQYGVVETGGDGGINGGIAGNEDGATGGRVTVYAAVDDMQAYLDKAERLGATVVMPVTDMGAAPRCGSGTAWRSEPHPIRGRSSGRASPPDAGRSGPRNRAHQARRQSARRADGASWDRA